MNATTPSKMRLKQQRGIHFVLLAMFMFVFLGLCALAIGLGFMANDNQRFRSSTNLAAAAALEQYLKQPYAVGETAAPSSRTYQERQDAALAMAKEVLNQNKPYSGNVKLGDSLTVGSATQSERNKLELGEWVPEAPYKNLCGSGTYTPGSCDGKDTTKCPGGKFPCMLPISSYPPTAANKITGVRVTARSPSGSLIAPFAAAAGFLPKGLFNMEASSVAAVNEQCTAVLLDVSSLSFKDTYGWTDLVTTATEEDGPALPAVQENGTGFIPYTRVNVTYPTNAAMFAYRGQYSQDSACTTTNTRAEYSTLFGDGAAEQLFWCNMADGSVSPQPFKRSTYSLVNTRHGPYRVNSSAAQMPEPMTTFLRSMKAMFQDYSQYALTSNKWIFFAFDDMAWGKPAGRFVDRFPTTGLTDDVSFLAVASDPDRWFGASKKYPNFVDRGWFPTKGGTGSNIPMALRLAMEELNSCPSGSKKSIILFTHGIYQHGFTDYGDDVELKSFTVVDDGTSRGDQLRAYNDNAGCVGHRRNTPIPDPAPTPCTKPYPHDDAASYSLDRSKVYDKRFFRYNLINFERNRLFGPYVAPESQPFRPWGGSVSADAQEWGISISVLMGGKRGRPNQCYHQRVVPDPVMMTPYPKVLRPQDMLQFGIQVGSTTSDSEVFGVGCSDGSYMVQGKDNALSPQWAVSNSGSSPFRTSAGQASGYSCARDFNQATGGQFALPDGADRDPNCAYRFVEAGATAEGDPNFIYYPRAAYSMARLASETKGVFVPLVPKCSGQTYNSDPNPNTSPFSPRVITTPASGTGALNCSVEELDTQGLAARALRDTIGTTPFYLVIPED